MDGKKTWLHLIKQDTYMDAPASFMKDKGFDIF